MICGLEKFSTRTAAHIKIPGPCRALEAPTLLKSGVRVLDIKLVVTELACKVAWRIWLDGNAHVNG